MKDSHDRAMRERCFIVHEGTKQQAKKRKKNLVEKKKMDLSQCCEKIVGN